jgi:hypothetical protein
MKRTLIVFLLVNLMLSACAPASAPMPTPAPSATSLPTATTVPTSTATPTSTPTATPTATPTSTATPTATPTPIPTIQVGDLSVPDPRVTNPELFDLRNPDAPIPQFVNAMKMAGIEITAEQVEQGLTFQELESKDGQRFVVGLFKINQTFEGRYRCLEGEYPLLIAKSESSFWRWGRATYPDFAKPLRIDISAVFAGSSSVEMLKSNKIVRSNFTFATIPFDYGVDIVRLKGGDVRYRLTGAQTASFSNSIMVVAILDVDYMLDQNPTSEEEVLDLIKKQLEYAKQLFPDNGIFILWNEIVFSAVTHPPTVLYNRFGRMDLVLKTYRMAREILGPSAVLLYNNDNNYSFKNGSYYYDTKKVVDALKQEGLIDGVGMQMHMFAHHSDYIEPDITEIAQVMKSYGLPVYITEFDINQANLRDRNKALRQAQIAYTVAGSCAQSGVCKMIGFFGIHDGDTWLEHALGFTNTKPLPFDENGYPKLFYYAVLKALYDAFVGN